ncbi:ABC transporter ATP-binding protein [Pseudofrankia sp. EUN1h]|nr:ABC transporter ATP-binding protein [Pseudofrankia sp. EUN1h]
MSTSRPVPRDGSRALTPSEHLPALLQVEDVSISFGGIKAVDQVSFTLDRGCCGIIGPNGAGKTTLLDTLAGVLVPRAGRILLDGHDLTRRSSAWRAQHGIRRTFQRHQAFGWLTVEENLLVACEWRGRSRRIVADLLAARSSRRRRQAHTERIEHVLELCGLLPVRDRRAATLPIGQVRLMEFARAIVDEPRLLLLDEPTSGLGPADTERLGSVVTELTSKGECAAILVEHDLDFVVGLCDQLMVLTAGQVLTSGDPAEVCRDPRVVSAYIGKA